MNFPIYMDYQATTPVDEEVLDAMLPYFSKKFGNAASKNHSFGWEASKAAESSREILAAAIGASPKEIVITSGSTEALNLAIKGIAEMKKEKGNHIITCATEHKAVLDPFKRLGMMGFETTVLPVDQYGRLDPAVLEDAITDKTILVAVMTANNEIGTIHPVAKLGEVCRNRGVPFLTDATQAVGKIPMNLDEMGIDLLAFSAHKLYGPKGIGALYVRSRKPRIRLAPLLDGGGHERGMRSGTLNVPGIVGFAKAVEISIERMPEEAARIGKIRDRLQDLIMTNIEDVKLNGHPVERIPGNLNISFACVEGEGLMMGIKEVAVSSGSACTSASLEPSHVMKAIGVGDDLAHSSIRFGIGRFTTMEEAEFVAGRVAEEVERLRGLSPLWDMKKEGIDLSTVKWSGGHGH